MSGQLSVGVWLKSHTAALLGSVGTESLLISGTLFPRTGDPDKHNGSQLSAGS
jgi:hypothetical protein